MRYWRMAMRVGEGGTPMWPQCKAAGVAAITYNPVARTDLTPYSRSNLPPQWNELGGSQPGSLGKVVFDMAGGDVILVKEGSAIVGRGTVVGNPGQRAYQYRPDLNLIDENETPWPHIVPVRWDADFAPITASVGAIQIATVEEITAADDAKVTSGAPPASVHGHGGLIGSEAILDLMIPEPEFGGHNPFNIGDQPDFYTPESIREDKEAQTKRSEYFVKYLVGISWVIGGPVPYVFRTRDGKIRSLDAGCLGSLSRRKTPDISFVLGSDRTIVAVAPSTHRMRMFEIMRDQILTDLGRPDLVAGRRDADNYLPVARIREILLEQGFEESETQKIIGLTHPKSPKRPFYPKRPVDGHAYVHRSLVMHPGLPETRPALMSIAGVVFEDAYYHHSNMRAFSPALAYGRHAAGIRYCRRLSARNCAS